MIVDNRPGAGGNLAAAIVAKSTPDGYTFMNISTAHTISQTLYSKLDYSLERDLTPVVVLAQFTAHHGRQRRRSRRRTSRSSSDWARKNRLIYASGGVGVISHLSMEMFKVATKIDATHVPYKGVGPAVPELISGQAHVMMNAIPELLPHTKGGKLRVIGALTEKRHPFIPDVPTFIEQGYKEFVMGNWTGIVAPAATPRADGQQDRGRGDEDPARAGDEQAPRRRWAPTPWAARPRSSAGSSSRRPPASARRSRPRARKRIDTG